MPTGPRRRLAAGVAGAAVVLVGLNLRPGASSVGPVLEEIRSGLGMGAGVAGLLTGLPGLCFGLVGALAVALSRRVGLGGGVALGVVATVAGLVGRAAVDSVAMFLLLSTLALGGMAVGNVLVPAWIKRHGGRGEVALMTAYGTCLIVGGSAGPLLTASLAGPQGWRPALGVWGVIAVLAVPLWLVFGLRDRADRSGGAPMAPPDGRILHSRTARLMAGVFALQAMQAYVQFGWLPQVYRDAGVSATYAGALLSLLNAATLLGGLLMPTVVARSRTLAPYFWGFSVLLAAAYVGLVLAPATVPWLWAAMLGLSGCAFPTVIALITARTREPAVTARLSGFVQPVGYLGAGLGPVAVGALHDLTGGWTLVLSLLAACAVPFLVLGLRLSRPVYVDDELAALP